MYSHVISSKFTAEVLIGTLRVAVGHGHLILSEQRIDVCFLISSDLAGLRLWIIKVTPRHTVRQKGPGPAGAHIPLSMKINATVSSNIRFKLREQLFTVVSNTIQVVIDIHNYDQACIHDSEVVYALRFRKCSIVIKAPDSRIFSIGQRRLTLNILRTFDKDAFIAI